MTMVEGEGQLNKPEREARIAQVNAQLKELAPTLHHQAKALLLPDGRLQDGEDSPLEKVMVASAVGTSCFSEGERCRFNLATREDHPHLLRADMEDLSQSKMITPEIFAAMVISPVYAPCDAELTLEQQLGYIARSVERSVTFLGTLSLRREMRERQTYLHGVQKGLQKFQSSLPPHEVHFHHHDPHGHHH